MSTQGSNTLKVVEELQQGTVEQPAKIPRLKDRLTEELVIALVGPVGSGCTTTYETLLSKFKDDYSYSVHYYRLSDFIAQGAKLIDQAVADNLSASERVDRMQTVGDELRKICGTSYLAAKAVEKIAEHRDTVGFGKSADGMAVPKKLRQVHIIDSIKHPDELKLLRATYGDIFWLIGVFAPQSVREQRLTVQQNLDKPALGAIMQRDYREEDDHGQKVRDVFYQADFFVRNDQENKLQLEKSLDRFLEIIFGSPVHTPTLDESSMYAAYAEAAKSACLSRQVGAAIVSPEGELIGLGRNDVPRFGGGLYTEDAGESDHRCHAWQDRRCHNDKKKDLLYQQIFTKLQKGGLLADHAKLEEVTKALKTTDAKQLIEYSRAVHAEMDAITAVARSHKPGLLSGTLYSTTFPCHSCARHIVASGINKVIFIEPYPKSLAGELHSDAVSESEADAGKKVLFLQFAGIAPKNILKLFNVGLTRKASDGKLKSFDKKTAPPVVAVSLDDYSTHEKYVIAELAENEEKASHGKQSALFDA
ncbi:anti-phage dCTP deaminase [Azospira restricta]|uniref:Deoxycytidylate deaminase n=1 Tax=Azospira restricta TaxID=404405 RepID=A0A974SPN6_9RHOO|nr:anti-phage dCTP deaminase [Azospira restricta]QRJ64135.1 deoxycytidylate deaminase [Azospira restricta]